MDSPRFQFRVRWTEKVQGQPTLHQSHRYRSEQEARDFIKRLLSQQPGVRVVLERRAAYLGPWEQVEPRGGAR